MKQLLILLVLISHINFSMFIAQVDERDTYTKSGQAREDINSLAQYIAQVFHYKHKPLKDSDDDTARYFHFETQIFCYEDQGIQIKLPAHLLSEKIKYPQYLEQKTLSQFFEIPSPPPEA